MNLEEQFELMKEFYDRDKLVVRLHTGDPCIYGAIQEQMAFFDRFGMSYHITPGISSFQAAAAALRSQFTIPEKSRLSFLPVGKAARRCQRKNNCTGSPLLKAQCAYISVPALSMKYRKSC